MLQYNKRGIYGDKLPPKRVKRVYYKESLKRFATINSQKTKNCKKISS